MIKFSDTDREMLREVILLLQGDEIEILPIHLEALLNIEERINYLSEVNNEN